MTTCVTTPFNRNSTTDEVLAGVDLTGKRAIVTGASSGLGIETARALASKGADVTLAVRDTEAGKRVAADITAKTGNANVHVAPLDLNSHASIAALIKAWTGPLHILVNNAGVAFLPLTRTPEGWEQQFATNHLGHARAPRRARCGRKRASGVRELRPPPHVSDRVRGHPLRAPELRATCGIRAVEDGECVVRRGSQQAVGEGRDHCQRYPGIIRTNLGRHVPLTPEWKYIESRIPYKSLEQGAATQVFVAASPLVEGIGGRYFEDCHEPEVNPNFEYRATSNGVNAHAVDPDAAAELWALSLEMLKQRTAA